MLVGCSGKPSEGMGQKALDHQIQTQSKGQIKLMSFHKTNGTGDDKVYAVEYEAEIEFQTDGYWTHGGAMVPFGFAAQISPYDRMMAAGMGAITEVHKGQRQTINGALQFVKTEKGWQGEDGQIY